MRFGDRDILCHVGAASLADRDLKKQDRDRLVWSVKMAKERKADVLSITSLSERKSSSTVANMRSQWDKEECGVRRRVNGGFVALSATKLLRYSRVEQSVARQVHNLKVVGSNPTPAPNYLPFVQLDRTRGYGPRNEGSNPLWEANSR